VGDILNPCRAPHELGELWKDEYVLMREVREGHPDVVKKRGIVSHGLPTKSAVIVDAAHKTHICRRRRYDALVVRRMYQHDGSLSTQKGHLSKLELC
jgi:hypothetical protein